MTTEELLKPRYLVIADYPGMDDDGYYIGQVKENIAENYCKLLDKYPHLFRRLEWWEMRDEKDMPEYVKRKTKDGRAYRAVDHNIKSSLGKGFITEYGNKKSYCIR